MRHHGHSLRRRGIWVIGLTAVLLGTAHATEPGATLPVTEVRYLDNPTGDEYLDQKCRLDLHIPENTEGFATIVWFHGGGLRAGHREIPGGLKGRGVAVVGVGYRLHPRVDSPVYLQDAAAAVAWVLDNIDEYGGDPEKVVVSGHSAGGYLANMLALDQRWLAAHDHDPDELAGLASISGHTITHFTVRQERGIPGHVAQVDDMAPLYHVRADAPPMLLVTGDRELEMLGRYEETAYFWRMMQIVRHPDATIEELGGFDHGGVVRPALELVVRFTKRVCED